MPDNAANVGQYASLAFTGGKSPVPRISYYDITNRDLKFAALNAGSWATTTVDSSGDVGRHTSLALAPASPYTPTISYQDATNLDLKVATYNGTTWTSRLVDGAGGLNVGQYTSLQVSSKPPYYPSVSYYDVTNRDLKYARLTRSGWIIETVDSGVVGEYSALALGYGDVPHITYYDNLNNSLKHAYRAPGGWVTETIVQTGDVGRSSIAADGDGNLHVSYEDASGTLKYAYSDGTAWYTQTVSSQYGSGSYSSLAVDEAGAVHIGYHDWVNNSAVYARSIATNLIDVPIDVYRRAALHLEEQRTSGQAPAWAQARLSDAAMPLYRPDLTGPAYFEFTVLGPSGATGFIIVSTADHDYPITNWSTAGDSPTRRMRDRATAEGKLAVKFYKLDVLSYAAENAAGELVATDGAMPQKVELNPDRLTSPPPITEIAWLPAPMQAEDPADGSTPVTANLTISGTLESPTFVGWDSWGQVKTQYTGVYTPFLKALRRNAGEAWLVESNAKTFGYTLFKGDKVTLPMLWPEPSMVFSGPGQALVHANVFTPTGLLPRLAITVTDAILGQAVPMTVTIGYANGVQEVVKVLIVAHHQIYLPLVIRDWTGDVATPAVSAISAQVAAPGTLADDGYTYWYVGGTKAVADSQQCWYDQYMSNRHSGCGATAWAMLICWGDRQAALGTNKMWVGRWGLFRWNGGTSNWDAVAPTAWNDPTHAAGVEAMTWEIADAVDTWCNPFNDNGATYPSDMAEVVDYLSGRSGVQVKTWYLPAGFDPIGYEEQDLRKYARNVIQNSGDSARPTVIGTGFFSHYPLPYGYRTKTLQTCWSQCDWEGCTLSCLPYLAQGFYVNEGWGGSSGEWVAADLFFTGRLTPHQTYADDVAVYRTSSRYWHFDYQHDADTDASHAPFGWTSTIRPTVGDFDRDGVIDDKAGFIYTHSEVASRYDWRFDYNNNRSTDKSLDRWTYEADGWPMALDVDRDGWVEDIAIYFPSFKLWRWNIDQKNEGHSDGDLRDWGFTLDDRPVTGDFDRDGYHDDIALYSPSTGLWHFDFDHNGSTNVTSGPWGTPSDLPFAGDFDQDGWVDDIGLFNSGDRKWWYDYDYNAASLTQSDKTIGPFGASGDLPLAGNFDTN